MMDYKENAIDALTEYFRKEKPLCKLIKTDTAWYLYDSGTNNILKCNKYVYNFITMLLTSSVDDAINQSVSEWGLENVEAMAESLLRTVRQNNFLKLYEVTNFNRVIGKSELKKALQKDINTLGIEITDGCNLRCEYCIYSENTVATRNHGNRFMNSSSAIQAIDFLKNNSENAPEITITFYGGEPLLNFDLIKEVVLYTEDQFRHKNLSFSLTTNATLLTSDIADFLADKKFSVLVSMDGSEKLHNRYRKKIDGSGSFKHTLRGLKHLHNSYKTDFATLVGINAVYSPPFSEENLADILSLRETVNFLPGNFDIRVSYYSGDSLLLTENIGIDNMGTWGFREYINNPDLKDGANPIAVNLNEVLMAKLSQRETYRDVCTDFELNACCIPGLKRVFVNVDGNLKVCEQMPDSAPFIGDVKKGIDIDSLHTNYFEKYTGISLKTCRKCWAINLCNSCYIDSIDENGFSVNKKVESCKRSILNSESHLQMFLKALEQKPDLLNYWKSIKLK